MAASEAGALPWPAALPCGRGLRLALAPGWDGDGAADRHFGRRLPRQSCSSLDAVHAAVASGDCAYGLLPLECSREGMVNRSHDLLFAGGVKVVAELMHAAGGDAQEAPERVCRRYGLVARPEHPADARDNRLMMAVVLPRHAGSLLELLAPLACRQWSVEHWCARPARVEGWHYRFHFTLCAPVESREVQGALQEAATRCADLKLLGRFRSGAR